MWGQSSLGRSSRWCRREPGRVTSSGGEHERSLCCDAPHLIVMMDWSCLQCGNVTLQFTLQVLQCELKCGLQCLGFLVCIVVDGFLWQATGPSRGRRCFTSSVQSCRRLPHRRRRYNFSIIKLHSSPILSTWVQLSGWIRSQSRSKQRWSTSIGVLG